MSAAIARVSSFAEAIEKLPLSMMSPTGRLSVSMSSRDGEGPMSKIGTESTLSNSFRAKSLERTTPATINPIATAVTKSTNTVTAKVRSIIRTYSRRIARRWMTKRQSIISQPTLMRMPARTASGIGSAIQPKPSSRPSRRIAARVPASGLRPPARMLVTVPTVAPAPGNPPRTPAARLPRPCPTSSRLGSWRVRVCESAINEVSRLSMEPRSARISAGSTMPPIEPHSICGICNAGSPAGIAPMVRASASQKSATQVPTIRAASGEGRKRRIRRGQKTQIAKAINPTTRSCELGLVMASGQAAIWTSGPPGTGSAPRMVRTCRIMMIAPIPVMKPEITE